MKSKQNLIKELKVSMAGGCIAGVLISLTVSIILTALQSVLIGEGKIGEGTTGAVVFLIRVIAMATGGFVAVVMAKNKTLPVIAITAGGYLLTLLTIGIIFYGESFHNFGIGLLSTLIGGAIPYLIKLRMPKKTAVTRRLR